MTDLVIHNFDSTEEQVDALLKKIILVLQTGIAENGKATLAVSGGGTPKPLFEALSMVDLDWSKVVITLVDDRWVNEDHDSSNEKLVKENLLVNKAANASFISIKSDTDSAYDGESEIEERIQALPESLDVVLLGMGDDGHTASLFPCADQALLKRGMDLENASRMIAIEPSTAPFQRMSMTAAYLLKAKFTALMVKGQSKADTLEKVAASDDVFEMPIRLFVHPDAHPVRQPAEVFLAV